MNGRLIINTPLGVHLETVLELDKIAEWKGLECNLMAMRDELYQQHEKLYGTIKGYDSESYCRYMEERYIYIEQCMNEFIEVSL